MSPKLTLVTLCLLTGCSSSIKMEDIFTEAQQIKAASMPVKPVVSRAVVTLPKEKLVYKAKYLGIPFCEYIVQNKGTTEINGREVYELEIVLKTNPFLAKLFKTKDRYVSYMDSKEWVVVRHEEYVKGGTILDSTVDFDHTRRVARHKKAGDQQETLTPIPNKVFDITSAGFYIRTIPLELGDTVELNIYADEKLYNFVGLMHSRAKDGDLFKPYLFYNGQQMKNLSAEVYFSPDALRMPLRAVLNSPVGSVSVGLEEKL